MNNPFSKVSIQEKTFTNGAEIFNAISTAILQAQSSVKTAAAWFTDRDLYEAIKTRMSQNPSLKVEIILDDNKENYYLPFVELVKLGATVKLLKGKEGNGRMHHKFCIVDDNKLLQGSYNWSKNAKYSNHETLTVSDSKELVQQFKVIFEDLLGNASAYDIEHLEEDGEATNGTDAAAGLSQKGNFEKFIEEIIFSEVFDYDREKLKNDGFDRSENSSGDHNIIRYELDSVYTDFVGDINMSETKKETLKTTIQHHASAELNQLRRAFEINKEYEITKSEGNVRILDKEISELKEIRERLTAEIKNTEEIEIKRKEDVIENKQKEYSKLDAERQSFKKRAYVVVPAIIFLLLTIAYLLIFYSSATYILVYASDDAMRAKLMGEIVPPVEIFHSEAIALAWEKGFFNFSFIMLFPLFFMGLIFMLNQVKSTGLSWLYKLAVIIPLDVFVAYKIASEIHENEYLRGMTNEVWHWKMVFASSDFYIVLVFGALAFLAYSLLSKFITDEAAKYFDADSYPLLLQLKEEIERLKNVQEELRSSLIGKRATLNIMGEKLTIMNREIEREPVNLKRILTNLENAYNLDCSAIDASVKLTAAKIENDLLSFSTHFLKDRVNTFMQGWNDFLYDHFAVSVAQAKWLLAQQESDKWLKDKLEVTIKDNKYN